MNLVVAVVVNSRPIGRREFTSLGNRRKPEKGPNWDLRRKKKHRGLSRLLEYRPEMRVNFMMNSRKEFSSTVRNFLHDPALLLGEQVRRMQTAVMKEM